MSKKKIPPIEIQEWFSDIEADIPAPVPSASGLEVQGSTAWSWECNSSGVYLGCGSEVENILGISPSDFEKHQIIEKAVAPESQSALITAFQAKIFPTEVPIKMVTSRGDRIDVIFNFLGYIQDQDYIHGFVRLADTKTASIDEYRTPTEAHTTEVSPKKSLQFTVIVISSIAVVTILAIVTLFLANGLAGFSRQAILPAVSTTPLQTAGSITATITIKPESTSTPLPTITETPLLTSTPEEMAPTQALENADNVAVLSEEKYLERLAYYADIFSGAVNQLENLNYVQHNVPNARCPSNLEWNHTMQAVLPGLKNDLSIFQAKSISAPPEKLARIYGSFITASGIYNKIVQTIEAYINDAECKGGLALEDDLGRGKNALEIASRQLNQARCNKSLCEVSNPPIPPEQSCPNIKSRLASGLYAYVSTVNTRLTVQVRRDPTVNSALVFNIDNGGIVQVVDGYKCADDWIWWKVRGLKSGLTGWAAERSSKEYWLLPINP